MAQLCPPSRSFNVHIQVDLHSLRYKDTREEKRERERSTDEIANIEGVIVGPESVVDARVPAFVSTHNVVSGGSGGGRDEDEEAQEDEAMN